jgi:hypothetical protein
LLTTITITTTLADGTAAVVHNTSQPDLQTSTAMIKADKPISSVSKVTQNKFFGMHHSLLPQVSVLSI